MRNASRILGPLQCPGVSNYTCWNEIGYKQMKATYEVSALIASTPHIFPYMACQLPHSSCAPDSAISIRSDPLCILCGADCSVLSTTVDSFRTKAVWGNLGIKEDSAVLAHNYFFDIPSGILTLFQVPSAVGYGIWLSER